MKITYIHHSCFVIEIEDCIFIFDYYKGELPKFDKDKRIIFFVSHGHNDHLIRISINMRNIILMLPMYFRMMCVTA